MGVSDSDPAERPERPERPERQGWRDYLQRKILVIFFLGFSAGLPFPLVYSTLTAWLEEAGLERSAISTFAWLGFAYSFKFLWAPLVDSINVPIVTRLLGRRRAWLFVSQLSIALVLVALSDIDPAKTLQLFTLVALAVAFLSATQDIVLDAYRIEIGETQEQGPLAAAYQYGYRMAILVATAGALYIAEYGSWSMAYKTMALGMSVGLIATLLCHEPQVQEKVSQNKGNGRVRRLADWFKSSVVGPFVDVLQRYGKFAIVMLLFIASFRLSDYVLGILAMPFYLDVGFTKAEIATVAKLYGTWISLIGIAGGGWATIKFGAARCVVAATILFATTNLAFAVLAYTGPDLWVLALTISADNFAMGFVGTVFIAYLSSLTSMSFTATQYALFSSLSSFFGKLTAGYSGNVQEATGWIGFFIYAAAIGIPAIILSLLVVKHSQASDESA